MKDGSSRRSLQPTGPAMTGIGLRYRAHDVALIRAKMFFAGGCQLHHRL
jgi:hypothetical protein